MFIETIHTPMHTNKAISEDQGLIKLTTFNVQI
jgi:hypothetical protein